MTTSTPRDTRPRHLAAIVPIAITLALVTTGCSSDDETADPFQAIYDDARQRSTTDFERSVLADSTITRTEYEEAHGMLASCLQDAGLDVELLDSDGLITLGVSPAGPETDAAYDRCSQGTTALVAPIYNDTARNPDNRNFEELIVECLAAEGLVGEDFTPNDLSEMTSGSQGVPDQMLPCFEDPAATTG